MGNPDRWIQPDPKQHLLDELTESAEKLDRQRDDLPKKLARISLLVKRLEFQLAAEKNPARAQQLMDRMLKLKSMEAEVVQHGDDLTRLVDDLLDFADAMDTTSVLPPKDE